MQYYDAIEEFHLKALFGILPMADYALLVEEAAYFVGEDVIGEVRHLLRHGGAEPQDGARNPGFDFA